MEIKYSTCLDRIINRIGEVFVATIFESCNDSSKRKIGFKSYIKSFRGVKFEVGVRIKQPSPFLKISNLTLLDIDR